MGFSFYMGEIIGLLVGTGVVVAFFAFSLKKAFTLSKTVSSWTEVNRSAAAYFFVPTLSLFIHPAGPSGSIPFFFMAIVLFSLERYRASQENSVREHKVAGWISAACVVFLLILAGFFFAVAKSNTRDRLPLNSAPAPRPTQDTQRPALTQPAALFGEDQDLSDALKTAKDTEVSGERRTVQAVPTRREERIGVARGKILNPEYDARTVTVDRDDESTIWDYTQGLDYGLKYRYGYVEKVNDGGELVVSTVVGGGSQTILNLFHVAPLYGSYSVAYSSGLSDCEKKQQIDYLRKSLTGKKIHLEMYNDSNVPLCGLSPRLFYPTLLTSLGMKGNDPKFVMGSVGIASDPQIPWYARSLTMLLAEEGYLRAEEKVEQMCDNQYDSALKRSFEIAKVQRKGLWGACK